MLTPAELQRMQIQTILSALEGLHRALRDMRGHTPSNAKVALDRAEDDINRLRELVVLGGPGG